LCVDARSPHTITMSREWIDFSKLRQQLSFEAVLKRYNVNLTSRGVRDQLTGPCPLPNHGKQSGSQFSVNVTKGIFQCFGCKQGGNVLDFAVLMEGYEKKDGKGVRRVAVQLNKLCTGQIGEKLGQPVQRTRRGKPKPIMAQVNPPPQPRETVILNAPLDFALKTLQVDHPYFAQHRLSTETVSEFQLGYCKRGALLGRIAIPLHDDTGQNIGYCGLILDEKDVVPGTPKYLFPSDREVNGVSHVFDPTKFLYNGFRVQDARDLIIVQECHTVWALWQGGLGNVVALMENHCSAEQAELVNIMTPPNGRVWLLTDMSAESDRCATSVLTNIACNRLCRWVKFDRQSDIAPEHPLLELLPKR
jgi:hypothetical protein